MCANKLFICLHACAAAKVLRQIYVLNVGLFDRSKGSFEIIGPFAIIGPFFENVALICLRCRLVLETCFV